MTAEDLKTQGNKAFTSGDYPTAIKYFSQAIELDPSNHVLYSNRSACYTSLKDYEKALEDANTTVKLKPEWAKGYSRKGSALHGLTKYEEAVEAYRTGLNVEPENALLKKGLEEVERAMQAETANPLASLFSGDILGKVAANPKLAPMLAQPDLVDKLKQIQQNPQMLNMYMQDPRMMQIMIGLMGLDAKVGTADQMAEHLNTETPETPEPTPKKEEPKKEPEPELTEEEKTAKDKRAASDQEKDLGNQMYKKRKFEEALAHYTKAYQLDETNVAVLTNKSAVLFEVEQFDECIQVCEKAVDLGRELRVDFKIIARALGRIGSVYAKRMDYENAIKYFEKSLSEHRTADILEKLRECEKLKAEADKQAYKNPQLSDEAREKGNEYFKAGNYSEAVKYYADAIKRNDQDPRNFSNRAACLMKLMAFPEADKDCDEAIRLDPNFVKAYIRKAAILYAKRDFMKCIDMCNEAKEKDVEKKHTQEIDAQIYKCYQGLNQVQSSENREETMKRAMADPEVQSILNDPIMQTILQQMQTDPGAVKDHMKNPAIAQKVRTLINAGVLKVA